MAGVYLQMFVAGLLLDLWVMAAEPTNTALVFVSQQSANTVLHRLRRYNSGHLEEMMQKDNLERECKEELCNIEEAREVFENDEKTMEFWAGYIDGNQCDPPPCQNGGQCQDGVNSYICWCQPSFSGKNCEIEVAKQCSVDNGGCSHFCQMKADQAMCLCAPGYELDSDRRSCTPTELFSCGQVNTSTGINTKSILTPRSSSTRDGNSSDYFDMNVTMFYDYYETDTNDPDASNSTEGSAIDVRSFRSDNQGDEMIVFDDKEEGGNVTEKQPDWASPPLPTITAQENTDQRVVGGDEATPGQIPWQVALMTRSKAEQGGFPFCGGSLLSELWVITAAHCLIENDGSIIQEFFIRVGEHDVFNDEGPERDHEVEQKILHPMYNYQKSPYNHDIALLKLAVPVELSNTRRPICLGPKSFTETLLRDSSSSLVSGWGRLRFRGVQAPKLQKLEVPYVDRLACKKTSRERITRYMFCAGYLNQQKDSCQGDSGGPHATKYKGTWFLTGIVSWGEDCAQEGKYGVYTRVSNYYPWISFKTGIKIKNSQMDLVRATRQQ